MNQEVTYESGASRLGTAIMVAVCVSPLVIVACLFAVATNEHHAVCNDRVIAQGETVVQEIGCEDVLQGEGKLAMLSCKLKNGTEDMTPLFAKGDFSSQSFIATGLSTVTEMLQCIEEEETQSRTTVGGGKETVHTYYYSLQWKNEPVDSSTFHMKSSTNFQQNCGMENPRWGADVPPTKDTYAKSIRFGSFTTDEKELIEAIPLKTAVKLQSLPAGWVEQGKGSGVYEKQANPPNPRGIGMVRTSFFINNWQDNDVTVLGENNQGKIQKWTGPSSWLCSGFQLATLEMGTISKEALFDKLAAEAAAETMFMRIVLFLILWIAFCCCLKPATVMAECVPCFGDCLGDLVEAASCMVSCVPATVLFVFVAGVMWLVMRPLVGIGLFLGAAALIFISYLIWVNFLQGAKRRARAGKEAQMENGKAPAE